MPPAIDPLLVLTAAAGLAALLRLLAAVAGIWPIDLARGRGGDAEGD